MSVTDWVPIASVAASAVVGLGVPAIVTRHQRRDLRADVLRRVGDVERLRWAPAEWDEYRKAIFALRGAALVAGAKRALVDHYIYLAHVARRTSDASWEEDPTPGPDGGGGISTVLGDLVTEAATILTDHLWHPIRKRRVLQQRFEDNRRAVDALRDRKRDPGDFTYTWINWEPPGF